MKILFVLVSFIAVTTLGFYNFQLANALEVNTTESDSTSRSQESISNISEFTTFKDNDFGFEIRYPADWDTNTKNLDYGPVIFTSADSDAQIIMKIIKRDKHETLKQFGDKFFKNSDEFRISEYYRNANTTFAGLPSIKMIGTYSYSPNVFQQMQGEQSYAKKVLYDIALVENKDAFFGLAYFADDQSSFNKYLPIVQNMIDSVKLTDKKPIFQEED